MCAVLQIMWKAHTYSLKLLKVRCYIVQCHFSLLGMWPIYVGHFPKRWYALICDFYWRRSHIHTSIGMYIHTYIHTNIYRICIRMYIHTYIHTHTHTKEAYDMHPLWTKCMLWIRTMMDVCIMQNVIYNSEDTGGLHSVREASDLQLTLSFVDI